MVTPRETELDGARCQALIEENAVLARHMARAQNRSEQLARDHRTRLRGLQADLVRERGRCIVAQTQAFVLHEDFQAARMALGQLAAADLVICQTGCISHNGYWRAQDHCTRHDQPCVFVETPSTAELQRAVADAAQGGTP